MGACEYIWFGLRAHDTFPHKFSQERTNETHKINILTTLAQIHHLWAQFCVFVNMVGTSLGNQSSSCWISLV
jgi:hypothetical protein